MTINYRKKGVDIDMSQIKVSRSKIAKLLKRRLNLFNEFVRAVEELTNNTKYKCINKIIIAHTIFSIMNAPIRRWYSNTGSLSPDDVAKMTVKFIFSGIFTK
jgi:hypothetical protein